MRWNFLVLIEMKAAGERNTMVLATDIRMYIEIVKTITTLQPK